MDQLVNTRILLSQAATKAGFSILEPQVQAVLGGIEIFQDNGVFSEPKLDNWLRGRDMSRGELLSMISQDLLLKQVQIGYGEGAVFALPKRPSWASCWRNSAKSMKSCSIFSLIWVRSDRRLRRSRRNTKPARPLSPRR
jgi:hypothetical protein